MTNTSNTRPRKIWYGTKPPALQCDGCHKSITGDAFSDVKTRGGPWGCFCDSCLPRWSIGQKIYYGTGLGQRYERSISPAGKVEWVKTQG
jgi:hypothetical protein